MPIQGVKQPDIIQIDTNIRLRKYDGIFDFAHIWYQDTELVYLVDGIKEAYTYQKLTGMYQYLNAHGELYFIEAMENGDYLPIGDVTFSKEDMPIVIGDIRYRGRGIGGRVIAARIQRGRELGYSRLYVKEIYEYNAASRKCFEKAGFCMCEKTDKGGRFVKDIM